MSKNIAKNYSWVFDALCIAAIYLAATAFMLTLIYRIVRWLIQQSAGVA